MKSLYRLQNGVKAIINELKKVPVGVFAYRPIYLERMDYESYWKNIGQFEWFPPRISVIAQRIEQGASVLDLGCGNGTLLAYLASTCHAQVSGVDVSAQALELARAKGLTNLRQADLSAANFQILDCYDYVVITEVLEHIPNPEDLLQKLIGHFGKAVLISIPNIGFYRHRLRLLCGRFPEQWGKHPGEHLRFWTLLDFIWWVNQLGYHVQETIPTNGFPYLFKIMPNLFAEQIVFELILDHQSTSPAHVKSSYR